MNKRFVIVGALLAAVSVILGAMGAHFLKSKLDTGLITEANLQTFETAVKYQMYHAIAILLVAFNADKLNRIVAVVYSFLVGILLFSGSLYFLATAGLLGLSHIKWLGPITPIGGLCFIAGWLLLAFSVTKKQ
jgi:uncharacterized membrane protein YgdD (TMEM256/DUF423 family)